MKVIFFAENQDLSQRSFPSPFSLRECLAQAPRAGRGRRDSQRKDKKKEQAKKTKKRGDLSPPLRLARESSCELLSAPTPTPPSFRFHLPQTQRNRQLPRTDPIS